MPPKPDPRHVGMLFLLLLTLLVFTVTSHSQSFGTSAGLLQGERIARVDELYKDVLKATSDTTAWIPFGTHDLGISQPELLTERIFAPTRFTLFMRVDTTAISHDSGPSITVSSEIALSDTAESYVNHDGTSDLIPSSDPLTETGGRMVPVPVYGGGFLRFIVTSADSAEVELHLWRVR
ncbi:hypothetical protein GF324_07315 [bacterium]|nr:hypothetical protein [bacterium]